MGNPHTNTRYRTVPFTRPLTHLLAALAALAPTMRAQEWVWRIPPLGAVEYRRTDTGKASEPQRTAAAAKTAPATAKLPDRYLSRLPPSPWLCQGELRADQKAVDGPVRDLRDLLRALACDLNRGSARVRCPRLLPFGDVTVSGSWSTPTAEGTQELRATFSASAPTNQNDEVRGALEVLKTFCIADGAGTVALTRTFDATKGIVRSWNGTLDVVADEGDKTFRRVLVTDRHDLVAVRDNQDADFRKRVAAAIAGGTQWVRDAIDEQKPFLIEKGGDDRNYGSGRLALALLTLLHGHLPADDPVVQRGFDELRKRRPEDSYSLAAALMAMAALHAPAGEAAALRDGKLAALPVTALPEKDHKVAIRWLQQLLALTLAIDGSGNPREIAHESIHGASYLVGCKLLVTGWIPTREGHRCR